MMSYEWYKYGGLEIFHDDKSIAFLQGDEANDLVDKLELAESDEIVQSLLEPYLVLEEG